MTFARTALLATAALLWSAAAHAAGPVPVDPAAVPFRVGALELVALRDAEFVAPNDGKIFGADAGPGAVARVLAAAGAPSHQITVDVDALLVKTSDRKVLLDTGFGYNLKGVLIASLAKAGVAPGDITDVLITHAHGDHVGGLVTAKGASTFPKAVIRMSAKEWASMQREASSALLVAVISPQVRTFEPGTEVVPGVTAIAIDGHTPGHVGYEIASGGHRLLDVGDTVHSSIISLAEPGWVMGFDSDPIVGKASRKALLARLAQTHEPIFSVHFPFPGVGTVEARRGADGAKNGYRWVPGLPQP